jgi:hypothetical protein
LGLKFSCFSEVILSGINAWGKLSDIFTGAWVKISDIITGA